MNDQLFSPEAAFSAALARHQAGDLPGAEAGYRDLVARAPGYAEGWHHLGLVQAQAGRAAEAIEAIDRALAIDPVMIGALFNLGLALQLAKRPADALDRYNRIVALGAESGELRLNMGNAFFALGRAAEAAQEYQRALALAPDLIEALGNLARLHLMSGRYAEPARLYRRIIEIDPERDAAREALARLDEICGRIDEATAGRALLIERYPERADLVREQLIDLALIEDDGRQQATLDIWRARFVERLSAAALPHTNNRDPERRLKVAYVGGDQFRRHTLTMVTAPLIEAHDKTRFEWFCYSDLPSDGEDEFTAVFRRHMQWRPMHGVSDQQYAEAIERDRIDVVIDPVAFTAGSRLLALAHRPAPVSISFPAMGGSGGVVDYVMVDATLSPEGEPARLTERNLHVPFAYCHRPLDAPPPLQDPPALTAGHVTFGSVNNLLKLSPGLLRAWGRLLARAPTARLIVKAGPPFKDEAVQDDFMRRLAQAGVDAARVTLAPWAPDHAAHMEIYNRIDVALDSFPYCGVTTTFEALGMGVPVVTRAGPRIMERYGVDILRAVGFEDGVANDDDSYVERALALAADPGRLRDLRRSLPAALKNSIACDGARVAAGIEEAIRGAWRAWCAKK